MKFVAWGDPVGFFVLLSRIFVTDFLKLSIFDDGMSIVSVLTDCRIILVN